MSRGSGFWNFMARRYARTPVADQEAYETKLAITRRYLEPDSCVLEVGCGTGSTALLHAARVKQILATDYSRAMIDIAEEKRVAAGAGNVQFACVDIEDLHPGEHPCNVVLALNVIHLLPAWHSAIDKVARLLEPGGVFISSTACINDSMPWFRYVARPAGFLRLLPPLQFFTSTELETALKSAGFVLEERWQPGPDKALFIVARKPL
jgi:ubiquinone/menaquinone biosynthesis C-methylase UbiE